jgi:dTDP-glucose 4,6-dehydratase
MDRVLVTGGAGFIGSNFVRFLRNSRPEAEITVLDALTYAGNRANLAGVAAVDFIVGDIRDQARVGRLLRERDIDCIVNFAAETHVDRSIASPGAFVETNVLGTHSLLEAAKAEWLDRGSGRPHRFHHVSTDEVFGSLAPRAPPSTEASAYAPNSPYSASKAAADFLVRAYHQTFALETTTSICSNNYGPRQYPEKLVPLFLARILAGEHSRLASCRRPFPRHRCDPAARAGGWQLHPCRGAITHQPRACHAAVRDRRCCLCAGSRALSAL